MKKLMFLFVMMFMTSVSVYSYESEFTREVHVDVAVSYLGSPWRVWFPENRMWIHYDGYGMTTVSLEFAGDPIVMYLSGRENSATACMKLMEKYLNEELPGHRCMIKSVGGFPQAMYWRKI